MQRNLIVCVYVCASFYYVWLIVQGALLAFSWILLPELTACTIIAQLRKNQLLKLKMSRMLISSTECWISPICSQSLMCSIGNTPYIVVIVDIFFKKIEIMEYIHKTSVIRLNWRCTNVVPRQIRLRCICSKKRQKKWRKWILIIEHLGAVQIPRFDLILH